MTTPPPPPGPSATRAGSSRSLVVLLLGVTAGVLLQATLAGLFLSGVGGARLAHTVVGWLLPYAALVVAVVAAVHHRRGSCPRGVAIATYPLPVLLWVQEMLGHLPASATTAVHVPLGVSLAVYPVVLAFLARSTGRS